MSEPTPGPWAVMNHDDWRNAGPHQPSSICHVGDYTIVTDSPSYEFHGTDETDARLIAAAPTMLKALKDALEAICWYDAENFENEHGIRIGEQLRVLIAKAEGQTEARPPITDSDDGFDPVRAGAKT